MVALLPEVSLGGVIFGFPNAACVKPAWPSMAKMPHNTRPLQNKQRAISSVMGPCVREGGILDNTGPVQNMQRAISSVMGPCSREGGILEKPVGCKTAALSSSHALLPKHGRVRCAKQQHMHQHRGQLEDN